ncbi:unnamed protein product [Tuber melanosporum]|uniref:(Perigord truffle) hypothetical protein n=1 Tax=Tuber melanosporum (strain Mel28) TaxID=656061 RepID=D5G4Q6_TUBMM|nr:uncharacterized protein GSTUM_00000053001 [Tuber melanosporum]CAZ79492.1 unnamed protein product [Tuber melanosporum]
MNDGMRIPIAYVTSSTYFPRRFFGRYTIAWTRTVNCRLIYRQYVGRCGYGISPSILFPLLLLQDPSTLNPIPPQICLLQQFYLSIQRKYWTQINILWGTTDTSYSLVHGRPIRPLPKRRLRSRLSDDANAALFGPPQQPTTPLFYFPYNNYAGDQAIGGASVSAGFGLGQHSAGDNLLDSSDEEDNSNASVSRGVGSGVSGASENTPGQPDSYEWSENTNNKKKRKIPTPANPGGSSGGNGGGGGGSHSSPGFSPASTPTPRNRWKPSGSSQRSPLSTISTGSQGSLRRAGRRYPSSPSVETFTQRLPDRRPSSVDPVTPLKGSRRNAGAAAGVGPPKQTQFTFVCESPVSASLAFSSTGNKSTNANTPGDSSGYPKSMHTVGTQTSPSISDTNANYPPAPQQVKKKSGKTRPAATSRQDYALLRRRRQEALGGGNSNGEIWICEFCEYESIFGEAPEALMRQYEIKDRKERRKLAEKRRLLEKAKQKGKKNSGKNGSGKKSGYSNGVHHGINSGTAPPPPPPSATDSQGTQSDNTPLASVAHTPALKPQRHSQQVQTEAYLEDTSSHVSGGRGANGAGGGGAGARSSGGGGASLGLS